MAALLDAAMNAGAWGLSTSLLDSDERRPAGALARRRRRRVRRASRRHPPAPDTGWSSSSPGLLGDASGGRAGRPRAPLRSPRHPAHLDRFHLHRQQSGRHAALDRPRHARSAAEGIGFYPQLSPRTVDFRLNWDSSMMFMSMPRGLAPGHRRPRRRQGGAAHRSGMAGRRAGRVGPHGEVGCSRTAGWTRSGSSRSSARTTSAGSGARSPTWSPSGAATRRTSSPTSSLANDCHPGVVAVGVSNADVEGVARTLADPAVLISSSDAGAHMQMLCASGDTTLVLTRHVRERGDFTLEQAVYELTGRQAEVFGFTGRGIDRRRATHADLVVFALDELHYDADEFVQDLPGDGARLRRPEGGYRATHRRRGAGAARRQAHRRAARTRHQRGRVAAAAVDPGSRAPGSTAAGRLS